MFKGATAVMGRLTAWSHSTSGFFICLAVMVLFVLLVVVVGSSFWQLVLFTAGVYAIIVLGLNLLTGYCGQISFGHNAFFAIGAYATAIGTTRYHLPPCAAMVAGLLMNAVLAILVGFSVLRLKGHYLGMATVVFGLAVYGFVAHSDYTRGFIGIAGVPAMSVGRFVADNTAKITALTWIVVAVSVVSVWLTGRSRYGFVLNAIRDDEDLAASCGIPTHRVKVSAFTLSALYASLAGSLYAHGMSYVSPESFSIHTVSLLFIILFMGGLQNVWGSVIAAILITLAPQQLAWLEDWYNAVFGILLLVLLVFDFRTGVPWLRVNRVRAPAGGEANEYASSL